MRTTSLSVLVFSSLLLAGCGDGSGTGSTGAQGSTGATGTGGSGGGSGTSGGGGSGQSSSGQGGGEPGPLWQPLTSGVTATLRGVWGTSATDVILVGETGTILHYDGKTFTPETGAEGFDLDAVGGDAAGRVWAVGKGPGAFEGVVLERKGTSWSKDATAPMNLGEDRGIFVAGPGDVYVISDEIQHLSGGVWTTLGHPFPTTGRAIWASSNATPPLLFAGGQNYLAGSMYRGQPQMDGSVAWIDQDIPLSDVITAVWGFAEDDVYAVGYDTNMRFDGTTWSTTNLGSTGLVALWGASSKDLYGVGAQGTIVHRHDGTPGIEASGVTAFLSGVWGDGKGTVFAAGSEGAVLRRGP